MGSVVVQRKRRPVLVPAVPVVCGRSIMASTFEFGGAAVQLPANAAAPPPAFGVQTFQLALFRLDHGHLASVLLPWQIECHLE